MSLSVNILPVHTANFSNSWRNDVLTHGRIRLSPCDVEEFQENKFKLKESRTVEISDIFNTLRVAYLPNLVSLFKGDDLKQL